MYCRLISLLLWLAMNGMVVSAQEGSTLVVTLKDIDGRPLVGKTVVARDRAGEHGIAQATTDSRGVARFAVLNETEIRVAVIGQLPNGAKLFQLGEDAKGMLVLLQPGTTHVDLLADSDGMVAPDPLTMSALEPGIPVVTVIFPTAPVAAMPTTTAIQAIPQSAFQAVATLGGDASLADRATSTEASTAPASPTTIWLGVALLVVLIGASIGIILLQRRWR